ncbi:DUF3841 domain-containing protein [Bacillus mycoides]|uniref:DUF3841 domain-containing protein n=1 Tax=Bacillus mycoides TaxID=1405 RepID=A0A4U3AF24_BACMY|nr:DUF3841 domain-containing protein [Bacillus mycoides]TKI87126.1 DUF3841 domain-containing protein [Bacillus mycoides]
MKKQFNIQSNEKTSNNVTILWTFQDKRIVDRLLTDGKLIGDWDFAWNRASYIWMINLMESKGIQCNGNPPIWAWHSCDGYKKPPSSDTARELMLDVQLEQGIQLIKFKCPNPLSMLTNYSAWNMILDKFIDNPRANITSEEQKYLFELYPETDEEWECHAIQSTIPYLRKEWITEITSLDKNGSFYQEHNIDL